MPDTLRDTRVVALDVAGMIAGAQFRGQFEDRDGRLADGASVRATLGDDGAVALEVRERALAT